MASLAVLAVFLRARELGTPHKSVNIRSAVSEALPEPWPEPSCTLTRESNVPPLVPLLRLRYHWQLALRTLNAGIYFSSHPNFLGDTRLAQRADHTVVQRGPQSLKAM